MVSVWPTVNPNSENHAEMDRRGLLVGNVRGLPLNLPFWDKGDDGQVFVRFYDPTSPRPQVRLGQDHRGLPTLRHPGVLARRLRAGDAPEDPESTLYHMGRGSEVQCAYPREHARGFAEGLWADGEKDVMLLCRSAWAGSQRYGAAVWSGDIDSTFEALAAQIPPA